MLPLKALFVGGDAVRRMREAWAKARSWYDEDSTATDTKAAMVKVTSEAATSMKKTRTKKSVHTATTSRAKKTYKRRRSSDGLRPKSSVSSSRSSVAIGGDAVGGRSP